MLTYQLVQPSFVLLKLASMFGAVPVLVDVSSGELKPKNTAFSRVILRIHRVLAVLKVIQLSMSIFNLSQSVHYNSRSVQITLVVIIALCAFVVALAWNVAFEKYLVNAFILISPLRQVCDSSQGSSSDCTDVVSHKTALLRWKLGELVRAYRRVTSYLRAYRKDFVRCFPSLSPHDMLTITLPVIAYSLLCLSSLSIIIGEPEDAFTLSLLNSESKKILVLRTATVIFDLTVYTFTTLTIHLSFYILCATWAIYTPQLKNLERFIDDNGIKSCGNMRYVWQEIWRLSISFNLFNQMCSTCFYYGKVMAFTSAILGSFYIIRFGNTDIMSGSVALIVVNAVMFYLLCFGNAYVITDTMDNVLQKIKWKPQSQVGISRSKLKRRVKSVRALVLSESGFREISRKTTPEFVDFYVNQVIALTITF